ncbi:MAG: DDE transposase [Spirochaetales bacterium]|nr:MAG: DDE transposase [Spirochaetales bacterium]
MATLPQPFLFSWKEIDAASDLDRLTLVLSALPDEKMVSFLEQRRGRGRDDFPIRPMWNAMLAGIVYQHPSAESLRRELRRNGELRQLCGFDPFLGEKAVPTKDSFSRFLESLIEHEVFITEMFHALVDELKKKLPDLGVKTAVDSKAIQSFGRPANDDEKRKEEDRRRDTDANWGIKTYKGTRKDGTTWEKVVKWFGYKLHLLVDSKYELPLAFELDVASSSDMTHLIPLVEDVEENHDELHDNMNELAADKGYDSADNNAALYDDHGVKPVIDTRELWKTKKFETPFPYRYDVFCYDESGKVYCHCPCEKQGADELRELFFVGFEKERMTLKYRCPAAASEFECEGRADCEKLSPIGVGDFGRVVRVPLDLDRRIFTPIARHTDKWEKAYDRRTSVERVNSRIDQVLGFERHTIRGKAKMKVRVSLALVVMLAMALGRIRIGQSEKMRSLIAPIERAA